MIKPKSHHQHSSNAMIEKLNTVLNPATGKMQEYRHLIKGDQSEVWSTANRKEIARLAQGRADKSIKGTNTLFFKHLKVILPVRKPIYLRLVAAYWPKKEEKHRVR